MEYGHELGLGLIWFTGDLACHVFDAERPNGECKTRPQGLLSDHTYLTNLDYKAYFAFLEEHPELASHVVIDSTLIVRTNVLAEEIGLPSLRVGQTQDPDLLQEILKTLYQVFKHVCLRTGIDPLAMDFTPRGVREHAFYRTTSGSVRAVTEQEIQQGLSVKPHRWISTNVALPEGAFRRRITVSRYHLYRYLLSAPIPVGQWEEGDAGASIETMMAARTSTHDILVRGRLRDLPSMGFPDAVTTDGARRYFTGAELSVIAEEGREIEVLSWSHGEIASPPALQEMNAMSLADAVILEITHRSWRENRGIGFWLAVAERMHLQSLASKMHQAGIPVLGYGSGKVVVATPEDSSARQEQDSLLLREFSAYHVQPPMEHLRDHPELGNDLTDHMTDLQALALAGPGLLAEVDDAFTHGDNARFEAALDKADEKLETLLTAGANGKELDDGAN